jgi:hypothetical protein
LFKIESRLFTVKQPLNSSDHVTWKNDLIDHLCVLTRPRSSSMLDIRPIWSKHTFDAFKGFLFSSTPRIVGYLYMITSLPSLAPTSPPLTGASTENTPNSLALSLICLAS